MSFKQLHDFFGQRSIIMLLITLITGWMVVGLAAVVEMRTGVSFVFPPTSIRQAGMGVFVAGFVSPLFIPIYWVQIKLMGNVTKKHDYVYIISVANAYTFGVAVVLFVGGLLAGRIPPPVFMVSPGVYLSLWLFKMVLR